MNFSKVTHALALAVAAVVTFFATPAGKALIMQYPILTPVIGGIGTLYLLYRKP